jgi:hypothetical protein
MGDFFFFKKVGTLGEVYISNIVKPSAISAVQYPDTKTIVSTSDSPAEKQVIKVLPVVL